MNSNILGVMNVCLESIVSIVHLILFGVSEMLPKDEKWSHLLCKLHDTMFGFLSRVMDREGTILSAP